MLKRKSGNSYLKTPSKCIKATGGKPKYQQQAISFAKSSILSSCCKENSSLHSRVSGILTSYLKDYKSRSKSYCSSAKEEKSILVQGPPGCGKTRLIQDLALALNLELLEINFSMNKTKSSVLRMIEEAANIFAIERNGKSGSLIFIDDIDVFYQFDSGLFDGIHSLLKSSKAPIVMTCCKIPKSFENSDFLKICRLGACPDKFLLIVKQTCDKRAVRVNDQVLKNIINYTKGNLAQVLSVLDFNTFDCFDWFYGWDFKIESECQVAMVEIENNLESLRDNYEKLTESEELSCEVLDNLVQYDLLLSQKDSLEHQYRSSAYERSLEAVLSRRFRGLTFRSLGGKPAINGLVIREKFHHFADDEDHVAFLSVLRGLPCKLHPLAMSWQVRANLSYLDVFNSL